MQIVYMQVVQIKEWFIWKKKLGIRWYFHKFRGPQDICRTDVLWFNGLQCLIKLLESQTIDFIYLNSIDFKWKSSIQVVLKIACVFLF